MMLDQLRKKLTGNPALRADRQPALAPFNRPTKSAASARYLDRLKSSPFDRPS